MIRYIDISAEARSIRLIMLTLKIYHDVKTHSDTGRQCQSKVWQPVVFLNNRFVRFFYNYNYNFIVFSTNMFALAPLSLLIGLTIQEVEQFLFMCNILKVFVK